MIHEKGNFSWILFLEKGNIMNCCESLTGVEDCERHL